MSENSICNERKKSITTIVTENENLKQEEDEVLLLATPSDVLVPELEASLVVPTSTKTKFSTIYSGSAGSDKHHIITSNRSRFTIVVLDVPSPLIKVEITVPTTPINDKGLPHALEHLIFCGCEKYPDGFIDDFARLNLIKETNAYTMVDRTTYEFEAACEESVHRMLPVYFNHILRPNLDRSHFYSEICHIDEKGAPAGVVYSEIDVDEQDGEYVLERAGMKGIFDEASPYRYDSGGVPADLLKLTSDEVRKYHKTFYHWDRMFMVVSGLDIDCEKTIEVMEALEDEYYDDKYKPHCLWMNQNLMKPPSRTTFKFKHGGHVQKLPIASEDVDTCDVSIKWRGPKHSDYETKAMIDTLSRYLCSDTITTVVKHVTREKHYCSDVDFDSEDLALYVMNWSLYDVNVENKIMISSAVYDSIIHDYEEGLDMSRIGSFIDNIMMENRALRESDPHARVEKFTNWLMYAVENADNAVNEEHIDQLNTSLDFKAMGQRLHRKEQCDWKDVLFKWFIDIDVWIGITEPSPARDAFVAEQKRKLMAYNLKKYSKEKLDDISEQVKVGRTKTKDSVRKMLEAYKPLELNDIKLKIFHFPMLSNLELPAPTLKADELYECDMINTQLSRSQRELIEEYLTEECPIPIILTHNSLTTYIKMKFINRIPTKEFIKRGASSSMNLNSSNDKMSTPQTPRTSRQSEGLESMRTKSSGFLNTNSMTNTSSADRSQELSTAILLDTIPGLAFDVPLIDGTDQAEFVKKQSTIHGVFDCTIGFGDSTGGLHYFDNYTNHIGWSVYAPEENYLKATQLLTSGVFKAVVTKSDIKQQAEANLLYSQSVCTDAEVKMECFKNLTVLPMNDAMNAASPFTQYRHYKQRIRDPKKYADKVNRLWNKIVFGGAHNMDEWVSNAKDHDTSPFFTLDILMNCNQPDSLEKLKEIVSIIMTTIQQSFEIRAQKDKLELHIAGLNAGKYVPRSIGHVAKKASKSASSLYNTARKYMPGKSRKDHDSSSSDIQCHLDTWEVPVPQDIDKDYGYGKVLPVKVTTAVGHQLLESRYRKIKVAPKGAPPTILGKHIISSVEGASSQYYLRMIDISRDGLSKPAEVALQVFLEYLDDTICQKARGAGTTYNMFLGLIGKWLQLEISPSIDIVHSLEVALMIINNIALEDKIDDNINYALRTGKVMRFFHVLEGAENMISAHRSQMKSILLGHAPDDYVATLKMLKELTAPNMMRVGIPMIKKFLCVGGINNQMSSSSSMEMHNARTRIDLLIVPPDIKSTMEIVGDFSIVITDPFDFNKVLKGLNKVAEAQGTPESVFKTSRMLTSWLRTGKVPREKNNHTSISAVTMDIARETEAEDEDEESDEPSTYTDTLTTSVSSRKIHRKEHECDAKVCVLPARKTTIHTIDINSTKEGQS